MVNFYHRFIPGAAALMAPHHIATLLHHPIRNAPTALSVSDRAVGEVLEQFFDELWRPLPSLAANFASQKLNTALLIVNCLPFIRLSADSSATSWKEVVLQCLPTTNP